MLIIAVPSAVILLLLYGSKRYILDRLFYKLPPGPFPFPFLGTGYLFSDDPRSKPWVSFKQLADKYGNLYTFYLGQSRMIVLSEAKLIHKLLVGKPKCYSSRADHLMPGFGGNYPDSVISAEGTDWVEYRRLCNKGLRTFGLGSNRMLLKVQEEAGYLAQELVNRQDIVETKFSKLVANAVGNVIYSQIFGGRLEYGEPKFIELMQISDTFFERPFKESAYFFAFPFMKYFSLPPEVADLKEIYAFVTKNVLEAFEQFDGLPKDQNPENFIEMMSQEGIIPGTEKFMNYSATMGDMLIAGLETTATAITWTVVMLCKYPEIQTKCQQEIDEVVGSDRFANSSDRSKMIYLESVMNEILRWVTVAPNALFHAVKNESDIVDGYDVPAGTMIMYNIWAVHHDQEYWKDPEVFRPGRWVGENGEILEHANYFIPFGSGPRKCLGENLARLEYFIFLVTILQRFRFTFPSDDYDIDLLNSRHGITNVPPKFDVLIKSRF